MSLELTEVEIITDGSCLGESRSGRLGVHPSVWQTRARAPRGHAECD